MKQIFKIIPFLFTFQAFGGAYVGGSVNYTDTSYKFDVKNQTKGQAREKGAFNSRQVTLADGYVIPSDALSAQNPEEIREASNHIFKEISKNIYAPSRLLRNLLRDNNYFAMEAILSGEEEFPDQGAEDISDMFDRAPFLIYSNNYAENEISAAVGVNVMTKMQEIMAQNGIISIAPNGDVTVLDMNKLNTIFNCTNNDCDIIGTSTFPIISPDSYIGLKPEFATQLNSIIYNTLSNITTIDNIPYPEWQEIQKQIAQTNDVNSIKTSSSRKSGGVSALVGYSFGNSNLFVLQTEGSINMNVWNGKEEEKALRIKPKFGADLLLRGGIKVHKSSTIYLNTGLGYRNVNLSYKTDNISLNDNQNILGFILGAGVEGRVNKNLGVFLEYNSLIPLNKKEMTVKENSNLKLDNLKISSADLKLGVRWYF